MSEEITYELPQRKDVDSSRKNYNDDLKQMRAKAAKSRIAARKRAERDARQKELVEMIPPEHRI